MAAMNPRQDPHGSSTEQHGGLSADTSHGMDAVPFGHPSPFATSSLKDHPAQDPAQQIGPRQESNDVEMAVSPPSISDSTRSRSPNLLSYPSRLWNTRPIVTTSGSVENVQRCVLTSTTIPVDDHPSSDYPRIIEQFDHAADMYTEYNGDFEDDREHVDTCSDGVYLHSAAPDSFIGIALPDSSPPLVLDASNPGEVIVISDDDDSEGDMTMPKLSLQSPKRFPSAAPSSFQATSGVHVGQMQTRPAHDPTTPRQQQGFRALSIPVPAAKGQGVPPRTSSRQSSVLRYPNLKEAGAKAEVADFDIVVMTPESSTTIENARSSADPEVRTEPQADSAAASMTGIFRSWVGHDNPDDTQRVKWVEWAETQHDDKRTGTVWTRDILLRNLKMQIQAKLQDGHVLILQKMPPAIYKAKLTTCGNPLCPVLKPPRSVTRMQPGAYRLSLEPISHLDRRDIPLAATYTIAEIERPAGKRNFLLGKGEEGVVWYCLSCVEDLWDGLGMIQARPIMVDSQSKRLLPPRRKVPDLSLVAAGEPCVLPRIRQSGSETAATPPASAIRASLAPRENAGCLPGPTIANLSSVAAGTPSASPFNRPFVPRSSAFPGTSVFAVVTRNPANAVSSPNVQGAFLRITPGSLGVPGSSGQERRSDASNFGDRFNHGMFGPPSPHPRIEPPQRRILVPQSRTQDPVSNSPAQANQQSNNVSFVEPRRHTGSTVLAAAAQALPSNPHQSGGTNGASYSNATSFQLPTNSPPAFPSLKPHDNWPPSVPTLASISRFIHPETRHDPTGTGYYALSSPQLYAFRKWKAVNIHAAIFENENNRKVMKEAGLHYEYAELGEVWQNFEERRTRGVMEIGGLVVEVSGEEVKSRRLSEVLAGVDTKVEKELAVQGWADEGPPNAARKRNRRESTGVGMGAGAGAGAGEGRKRVKLTLKVGKKEEGSGDEADGEGDGDEESDDCERTDAGQGGKKVKITLRMGPVSTESQVFGTK